MSNGYQLSACVFIRDTFDGAFCLFESVSSIIPFVDELIIMDLGSTDGTLEILKEISEANPKIRLVQSEFPEVDAGAFATLANDLVSMCKHEYIWYFQADEIWHQDLLKQVIEKLFRMEFDLSFWRIQFRENFQAIKWFPHLVHRISPKDNFVFVGDGMNSDRTFDSQLCSNYDGGYFPKWGGMEPLDIPVEEMVLDVSLVGAFLENIPKRREMHAPFWHEEPTIEGLPSGQWMEKERRNENWSKTSSPFNIPAIMRWHLGRPRYELRTELFEALKNDTTHLLLNDDVEYSGDVIRPEKIKEEWR